MNHKMVIPKNIKGFKLIQIFLLALPICFVMAGCSNKAVYDNIQINNQLECQKLPPSQYDDCMKKNEETYAEYKRKKDELEK